MNADQQVSKGDDKCAQQKYHEYGFHNSLPAPALSRSLGLLAIQRAGFLVLVCHVASLCEPHSGVGTGHIPINPEVKPSSSYLSTELEILAPVLHVVRLPPEGLCHAAVHQPTASAGSIHLG